MRMFRLGFTKVGTVLALVHLISCSPCSHKVLSEATSPSDRMIATVFESDCGATTDFATSVSIRNAGKSFSPTKHNLVVGIAGQQPVTILWRDDSNLIVRLPKESDARIKKEEVNGVTISYEESNQ
jgi:hypothetical protein